MTGLGLGEPVSLQSLDTCYYALWVSNCNYNLCKVFQRSLQLEGSGPRSINSSHLSGAQPHEPKAEPHLLTTAFPRTWLIQSLENYGCPWTRALGGHHQTQVGTDTSAVGHRELTSAVYALTELLHPALQAV